MATDLRASASLVIAGLVAEGETHGRPHLPPRPRLRPDGSQAARARRRHRAGRDVSLHHARAVQGPHLRRDAAAAARGRHRAWPKTRRPVAQADPRAPRGPTCAWCWCAPPTCRPTCSTAAPTSAWPARTCCSSTAARACTSRSTCGIARCRMSVAARADFDYAAAVRQGSRIRVATKYTQHRARALRRQGRARRPDQALRLDGAGAADRPGRRDRRPGLDRQHAAGQPPGRGRGDHATISARLVVNQAALKLKREPIRAIDRRASSAAAQRRDRHERSRLRRLDTADADFEAEFARAARTGRPRPTPRSRRASPTILADVRARGDAAVLEYTRRFDGLDAAVGGRARDRRATSCAPRSTALHAGAARARSKPPRARVRGYHERQLEACGRSLAATATPTARCSARRSRRSTASASTCRAARRPTRRAC